MSASDFNLDDLDLVQLKALQKRIDVAIDSFAKRKMQLAVDEMEEVAKKHGFTLADFEHMRAFTRSKGKRSGGEPIAAKYADPNDSTKTWSGRGRAPFWFKAALDSGKTAADLLIA